jgi:hypothetical protein
MRGPAFFAYANNYLIDVKFGVIVDVEASRAIRQAEVGAAKTMIERTQQRFSIMPERLAADSAYGSATALNWIVNEKNIVPHIPVIDKSEREDGTLSRSDFTFDKDRNAYVCPEGKLLRTTGRINDGELIFYRARTMVDANKQRSIPGTEWNKKRDSEAASRAVKEYLATLDDAAYGAATDVTPKFVSPSDPAAPGADDLDYLLSRHSAGWGARSILPCA